MRKIWRERAAADYRYWEKHNPAIADKIDELIEDIERTPFEGKGRHKPLQGNLRGWWRRQITLEHRLVYRVKDEALQINSCRGHYE